MYSYTYVHEFSKDGKNGGPHIFQVLKYQYLTIIHFIGDLIYT